VYTVAIHHAADKEQANSTTYLDLAADGALAGLTRAQVVTALIERIGRDVHYLAYREACRRHTRYDDQVTADLRALALAACWLSEPAESTAPSKQVGASLGTRRESLRDRARRERQAGQEGGHMPTGGCRHAQDSQ